MCKLKKFKTDRKVYFKKMHKGPSSLRTWHSLNCTHGWQVFEILPTSETLPACLESNKSKRTNKPKTKRRTLRADLRLCYQRTASFRSERDEPHPRIRRGQSWIQGWKKQDWWYMELRCRTEQNWDPELRPWAGTLGWDPGLGPWTEILGWDPGLGPWAETLGLGSHRPWGAQKTGCQAWHLLWNLLYQAVSLFSYTRKPFFPPPLFWNEEFLLPLSLV